MTVDVTTTSTTTTMACQSVIMADDSAGTKTNTTRSSIDKNNNGLLQRELKEDWNDFESPTTKSIEMLEDSGHLVNIEEDPVLIAPSVVGEGMNVVNNNDHGLSMLSIQEEDDDAAKDNNKGSTGSTTDTTTSTTTLSEDKNSSDNNADDQGINENNNVKQFVSPKDFELLKVIGMGAFGKVLQVRNKKSNKVLAMKVISKRLLRRKTSYIKQMQLERDVLKKIRHPFIVTMHCSFQAKEKLFIVMDFLAGGELFERLGKEGIFLESQACFYLAEIILALEHLHSHNILHRDLKPENILLGSDGHVCLTDFGLAKDFSIEQGYWSESPNEEEKKETEEGASSSNVNQHASNDGNNHNSEESTKDNDGEEPVHRARTICGTTEYMAPEMIARKGYGKAADFWSLGCVAYEMLSGNTPFVPTRNKGEKDLMRKILCERIKMPPMITSDAVKLLKGLLNRNPQDRLGNTKGNMFHVGGVTGLKQMSFFSTIHWTKLEHKQMEPPAKFTIQNDYDTQYFHEEFLNMTLPRSITEMSKQDYQPKRCASNQFKGFSFIQSDFDLPDRNDSELDTYWNGTADPDCDSVSECASGIFNDTNDNSDDDGVIASSTVVVDKIPPPSSSATKKKKKKKNKAAAATAATLTTDSSTTTPTATEKAEPVKQETPTNFTAANHKPPPQSQAPVDETKGEETDVNKIYPTIGKPTTGTTTIPNVPSTQSLSSAASATSSIRSATKLSKVASLQQQEQDHPETPATGDRRKLLTVSSALTPSSGSYVPPHLRSTESFGTSSSSITKSPGSSSQYKKGPTYLASPNIYARSNVALNGTKVVAMNSSTSSATAMSINSNQQRGAVASLPASLPSLPTITGGTTINAATTIKKKPTSSSWATVTSSKKGGTGGNTIKSGIKTAASTTSSSSVVVGSSTSLKPRVISGATTSNPSTTTTRKPPGSSSVGGGWSQTQRQRQPPHPVGSSAVSTTTKSNTTTGTSSWVSTTKPASTAPVVAPSPPPPKIINNPNDFPSWPTLGGGGGGEKKAQGSGSNSAIAPSSSASTPLKKKPPPGVWGISSSASAATSNKKKSTTTPNANTKSPWKQAR